MSASNSEQIGCMLLYVFAQIEESKWDLHSFVYKAQKLRAERNIRMDSILCVLMAVVAVIVISNCARTLAHSLDSPNIIFGVSPLSIEMISMCPEWMITCN